MTAYIKRGRIHRPDPAFGGVDLSKGTYVVGLDPSLTAYGITFLNVKDTEGTDWVTWVIKEKSKGTKRLALIRQQIMTLLSSVKIKSIAMEGYSFGSSHSQSHKAGELGGAVKLALYDVGLPEPMLVPPTSLKKFTTGSGNSKKSEMLLEVYKRWGVSFDDDNAADSFALARMAQARCSPSHPRAQFQQDVLSKILKDEG